MSRSTCRWWCGNPAPTLDAPTTFQSDSRSDTHLLALWTRELERQVHEFIDNWLGYHADYGAEITWLPHLLRHVYGDARAQAWITAYRLED
jgi:hypothetical protein